MQIERQSVPGAEVLAIQGQLDATTAPQLEGALEDAADYGGGQPLIIDLAGVGLISSAALRVLLSAAKRARRESGKIHLCAANAEVRKVFEISGLAALFDLHDTRDAALASAGVTTAAEPVVIPPPAAIPPAEPSPGEVPLPEAVAERPVYLPPVTSPVPEPALLRRAEAEAEPDPEFIPSTLPPVADRPPEPPPITPPPIFAPPPAVLIPPEPAVKPVPPPLVPPSLPVVAPTPVPPPVRVAAMTPPPPVPPPARTPGMGAPPPPAPARVPSRTPAPVGGVTGTRKPFPVFPLIAGVLGIGLILAAVGYFLFNRFAPKTGLAEVTPEPTTAPSRPASPSAEPSILPMDAPTPAPTVAPEPTSPPVVAADSSPTPTPTPALVTSSPTPPAAPVVPGGDAESNRIAAPTQVNFDPSDPRNSAVRESVLKRIESMPVSRKVKDQLYGALERARGMGRVATITFGTGRTDLSANDVETLRKGLAQPVTARLTADPTVVIVVLGYADTKGDATLNRKLSEQRAARTMDALKGPCGLLNVMHSIGMGASELLDGKNAEANRAVEVWAVQP